MLFRSTGQASIHAPYDQCIVEYMKQVGITVEWFRLEDKGIFGNAHFSYLEKNNLDIAAVAEDWISKFR